MIGTVESEQKVGTCEWCGGDGQIFADNSRCESCDSSIRRCSICKVDQHTDDLCRHLFQDSDCEWRGAGIDPTGEGLKEPFFELLSRMPDGFAADLRTAIRSGCFHTSLIAPLIGGGGVLEMHGMPGRRYRGYGDALIALGDRDDAGDVADGFWWLVSLYDKATPKANRTTVSWIDEWLKLKAVKTAPESARGRGP